MSLTHAMTEETQVTTGTGIISEERVSNHWSTHAHQLHTAAAQVSLVASATTARLATSDPSLERGNSTDIKQGQTICSRHMVLASVFPKRGCALPVTFAGSSAKGTPNAEGYCCIAPLHHTKNTMLEIHRCLAGCSIAFYHTEQLTKQT